MVIINCMLKSSQVHVRTLHSSFTVLCQLLAHHTLESYNSPKEKSILLSLKETSTYTSSTGIVSKHSACSNVYTIQCLRYISVVLWLGCVPQLCQAIGTGHTIVLLVAC